ncbi:MAG: hypothetical protein RR636_13280 [Clostridium sp.]|uniref:hypothetical protein n=1 Tax=Clostridium sp. TaxID=1506 RepID=UPI00302CD3ED
MATIVNVYILTASIYEIIFSAKDSNDQDILTISKEDILLHVNNNVFVNFSLITPISNDFQYTILIDKGSILDNYDVILFNLHGALYTSDKYIIYLYQNFYLGESLTLLPNLFIDPTKDSLLKIDLIKTNSEDLSNISGQQILSSGLGTTSNVTVDGFPIVNIPFNIILDLKDLMGYPVINSKYTIDIKIAKES